MQYRIERDTMGEVKVPMDKYWGAQTQRSLDNFKIGYEKMPVKIIMSFAILKKAAAAANYKLGDLDKEKAELISKVCDEIRAGKLSDNFPLAVWQTGSGTHTNMNINEVIANRGNEIAGKKLLHPNDDVNRSQSSNDTFPSAMHIAAVIALNEELMPAIWRLEETFRELSEKYDDVIKTGRTHLQDAAPLTLGQEIGAWAEMLAKCGAMIGSSIDGLSELALGGTAVGTGLNAHQDFGWVSAEEISKITSYDFVSAYDKFHALTSKDAIVFSHGAIKTLAGDLMKIANDVRWLASGPRCGIGEIFIPENEPGSSIMPGKVNPTQCEALSMVCVQVMGNDATIGFAASQGNFQLNVYMPVIIHNFLQSIKLLADSMDSFRENCAAGIKPNEARIADNLAKSLMLATALNPHIGYEKAAAAAKLAYDEDISLKEAVLRLNLMPEDVFDSIIICL